MENEEKVYPHCDTEETLRNTEEKNTHNHGENDSKHEHSARGENGEPLGVVCCCGKEHGHTDKKARIGEISALIVSFVFLILGYFDWAEIGFEPFYYVNPAWIAVVLCGAPIFISAVKSVAQIKITTPILIAMAMTAAIVLEIVGFFYNVENDGHGHSYVFAAGEIAFLMALGGFIEDATIDATRKRIEKIETESGYSVAIDTDNRENRANISKTADKIAAFIIPFVLVAATAVGLVSGFAFKLSAVDAIIRAVTVLVAFCPCSLALAAPVAVAAGTGRAAMDGIFVKSGENLELLSKVSAVCFDESETNGVSSEGLEMYGAEAVVLPSGKQEAVKTVEELKKNGKTVLYVGNDAEIAKNADCAAGFGGRAEFSDITLTDRDGEVVKTALKIAKRTILTVKCNIILALTINCAAVVASFFGWLSPAAGALVHNCTSVFVVLSSVLILYKHKKRAKVID